MNPKKILKKTTPAQLAKARGKLQSHSTRDFPRFEKTVQHVIDTFNNLGYKIEAVKK